MTTVDALLNSLERGLLANYSRPQYDISSGTTTTSATSISLTTTTMLSPGALIDAQYELMYVRSFTSPTATVIRGFQGTSARQLAASSVVSINPQVNRIALYDAVIEELKSWDHRVFITEQEVVTWGADDSGAEANPSVAPYRVLSARPQAVDSTDQYTWFAPELRKDEGSQFPSGYSLHLPAGYRFGRSTAVDITYAIPFDLTDVVTDGPYTFATTRDLESDLGMSGGMLEIIRWGVLYRATANRQISRLDAYTSGRSDIEQGMPAMSPLQASAQFKKMRDQAYDTEARRLLNIYPLRTAG